MSKNSAIDIFLRVRPTKKQSAFYKLLKDDNKVELVIPKDKEAGYINNTVEKHAFDFNGVLGMEAKQDEVFDRVAKEVIDAGIEGYNGTIFAYGQTGSGKTYTMTGGIEKYADRGIIPRTINYIFSQMKKKTDLSIQLHCSYIEIYNNDGYDLLDENHQTKNLMDLPKVIPRESKNEEIILQGLSVHKADTEEDALNLLFIGDTNRVVSETPKNDASTRSHCIFILMIESRKPGSEVKTISRLHLVDLSGSERIGKTQVEGLLQKEARYINLSLHYLEHVIVCLNKRMSGENVHVPYRNSLMTMVLRDSLGGNCKTRMVATISAEDGDLDESISTCRFAARVALIKNTVQRNESVDPSIIIERLKRENALLKAELQMIKGEQTKDVLENYEIEDCKSKVNEFIESSDPSAVIILNDRLKINECFYYMKHLLKNLQNKNPGEKLSNSQHQPNEKDSKNNKKQQAQNSDQVDNPQLQEEIKRLKLLIQQRDNEIMILLNMINKNPNQQQNLTLPVYRDEQQNAIQQDMIKSIVEPQKITFPQYQADLVKEEKMMKQDNLSQTTKATNNVQNINMKEQQEVQQMLLNPINITNEQLMDRAQCFELFRKSYRKKQAMEENQEILKEKFNRGKYLGQLVNDSRNKINDIKNQIEELRKQQVLMGIQDNNSNSKHPDEDRLQVEIEKYKKIYKDGFDELKDLKQEIERIKFTLEKNREKMQSDFDKWLSVMLQQKGLNATSSIMPSEIKDQQKSQIPVFADPSLNEKLKMFEQNANKVTKK